MNANQLLEYATHEVLFIGFAILEFCCIQFKNNVPNKSLSFLGILFHKYPLNNSLTKKYQKI